MIKLGPAETRCLKYLRSYFAEHGCSPTINEISAGLRVRKSRAGELVGQLESKNYLRRHQGFRCIRLTETKDSVVLNREISALLRQYAGAENIALDTAANELLRGALGAA